MHADSVLLCVLLARWCPCLPWTCCRGSRLARWRRSGRRIQARRRCSRDALHRGRDSKRTVVFFILKSNPKKEQRIMLVWMMCIINCSRMLHFNCSLMLKMKPYLGLPCVILFCFCLLCSLMGRSHELLLNKMYSLITSWTCKKM